MSIDMQLPVSLKKRTCRRRSSQCLPIANAVYISVSPIPSIWIRKMANLFRLYRNMAKFKLIGTSLEWVSQDTVRGPQQVRRLSIPDALHSPSWDVAHDKQEHKAIVYAPRGTEAFPADRKTFAADRTPSFQNEASQILVLFWVMGEPYSCDRIFCKRHLRSCQLCFGFLFVPLSYACVVDGVF